MNDLLGKKNYADLKKAAEDRSFWRTVRRGCHKPTQWLSEQITKEEESSIWDK